MSGRKTWKSRRHWDRAAKEFRKELDYKLCAAARLVYAKQWEDAHVVFRELTEECRKLRLQPPKEDR